MLDLIDADDGTEYDWMLAWAEHEVGGFAP